MRVSYARLRCTILSVALLPLAFFVTLSVFSPSHKKLFCSSSEFGCNDLWEKFEWACSKRLEGSVAGQLQERVRRTDFLLFFVCTVEFLSCLSKMHSFIFFFLLPSVFTPFSFSYIL